MLGITKKYNQFKESPYFAGGKFVIYATCICLAATFAVGCLGLIIGFPLLTFPLAMLISNPVVWVLMGIVVTAAYKMVVEPLFHLAKNYINGKRASKGEKSAEKDTKLQDLQGKTPEKQARPKTPDRDSGIVILEVNKDSFVYKTNKKEDYKFRLSNFDIIEIARVRYKWEAYRDKKNCKILSEGVFFSCSNTKLLEQELKEYKNKVEREGSDLVFTSILNLNGNHWVTLVISHDEKSKKFRAYYCDSFGNSLPNEISSVSQETLEIDNSSIESFKIKQQKDRDTWNCGIFALENAKKVTDMLRESKSFDEINDQLKYELSSEQLIEKRKELAKALKKDEQSRAGTPGQRNRRSSGDSAVSSDSGVSEISSPVDVAVYEANHGSQNLINQTQAGNYHYLLQQADIGNLARVVHNLNPEVYEIIGSNDQLKKQLNRFKSKVEKSSETQKLTFIISLQNGHWVTLCVSHCNKQFSAYYYDSLNGKQYRSTFSKILQEGLNMCENNIRFFEGKTQNDGSNCGIFALEAASRINQMLDKGKSLDDVDEVLLEYKPTGDELEKLRTQLAEILNNDEVNSEFVVTARTSINNASRCSIL